MKGTTMKAFSSAVQKNRNSLSFSTGKLIPVSASNMRNIVALMYAGLAATLTITFAVWTAGMSALQIGDAIGLSARTVEREARFSRAWLLNQMSQ